jgi:amidohydrolase
MPAAFKTFASPTGKIFDYARRVRHDLHQTPELAFEEYLTSKYICHELNRMRIPHLAGLAGGTGIAAFISGHNTLGGVIGIRAEMDALPVEEATGAAYTSRHRGRMHACGHDGHMAIALATSRWLWQRRDSLCSGIIVYFQPAEEGYNGGERMCNELQKLGVMPNIVFGLHGWPELPVGSITTRAGILLANVDSIQITVKGKATHGSQPQRGINPIPCAGYLSTQLQLSPSSTISEDSVVLSIGCLQAGCAANIIPAAAVLHGTLRTLSADTRREKLRWMESVCRAASRQFRCQVKLQVTSSTPAVVNDKACTEILFETADTILGRPRVRRAAMPFLWSEDFAYILQKTSGCFFVLGTRPVGRRTYPMLHSPHYDFPDAALAVGIRIMSALAQRSSQYLQR